MSAWLIASYAAIATSAVMILWIVVDVIKTERTYSNEVLTSSREGELEALIEEQSKG